MKRHGVTASFQTNEPACTQTSISALLTRTSEIKNAIQNNMYRAILRYSFCRGRDILNIHPFITLSILMVETSYCTYMEAVTCVFQCVINIFL